MSDLNNNASSAPQPTRQRRNSLAEMFNPRGSSNSTASTSPPSAAVPASPGVPHHRRGTSITALGFGGNGQNQASPYNAFAKQRRASISTSSAASSPEFRNSFEDGAVIIEEEDSSKTAANPPSPSFARRLSFGAQALRDVKQGGGQGSLGGGRRPSNALFMLNEASEDDTQTTPRSPGSVRASGEGFNWSEALRDKTKRAPSFSTGSMFPNNLNRARTTTSVVPEPPKEMPKPAAQPTSPKLKKPDHLGERMLRGDFMMD